MILALVHAVAIVILSHIGKIVTTITYSKTLATAT